MPRSGRTLGTVVRWDDARGGALIEAPELPGGCWADAGVVVHSTTGAGSLRAGQVVEVDWVEPGAEGQPFRAVRVDPRGDLQATVGG
jgi:cold shock protein